MARKGKKKSGGGLKGFILLVILIAGALYVHQNREKVFSTETVQAIGSQTGTTGAEETASANTGLSLQLEIPKTVGKRDEMVIRHLGYTVSYNNFYKTPNWVAWELTRQETEGDEERTNKFLPDPELPEPRVTTSDYTRSGYDRGHMAPAADMKWSEQAMRESFYMTNICPQFPALNRGGWKQLEDKVRDWAIRDSAIIVITGPVVGDAHKTIAGDIAVPDAFFKVLLAPSEGRGIAFVYQNAGGQKTIARQAVSIDSVETLTGFDFFRALPDDIENRIEQSCDYNEWNN